MIKPKKSREFANYKFKGEIDFYFSYSSLYSE